MDQATIDQGWGLVETNLKMLHEDGSIPMTAVVIAKDGDEFIVVPQAEVINSPELKSRLFVHVRSRVREMNAHAVMILSDSWITTSESQSDADLIRKIGIDQAIKLGLCKEQEAIICSIFEWTGDSMILQQLYRRDGEKIIDQERRTQNGIHSGRMSGFFDAPKTDQRK
jgi:hypothetical protein